MTTIDLVGGAKLIGEFGVTGVLIAVLIHLLRRDKQRDKREDRRDDSVFNHLGKSSEAMTEVSSAMKTMCKSLKNGFARSEDNQREIRGLIINEPSLRKRKTRKKKPRK